MQTSLLSILLAFLLPLAGLEAQDSSIGCDDPNYALTHDSECGGEILVDGKIVESVVAAETSVGCDSPEYALTHDEECGEDIVVEPEPEPAPVVVGCDNPEYALTHDEECGQEIIVTPALPDLTAGAIKIFRGSTEVSASDIVEGDNVKFTSLISNIRPFAASAFIVNLTIGGSVVATENYASGLAGNSSKESAFFWTAVAGTPTVKVIADSLEKVEETDEANNIATITVTVKVSPPPACVPSVSCSQLGCGTYDSCGNFCGSCPPAPAAPVAVDNPPTATINVPASAGPGSQLRIVVNGDDDNDVAQLLLFDSGNNQLASFNCAGVQTSCSNPFAVTAPSTPGTTYTFRAKSKDSANQFSAFASATGTTTFASAVPVLLPPSPLEPAKPLQEITIKFPLQPLFIRSISFTDSDCVRPGESALLAVKVQNTGRTALKDVKFTVTVPELGIYASEGPVQLKTTDKSTRFFMLEVPEDAEEGTYYLRFAISNNKFNRVVHRTIAVDSSC